MSVTIRRARLTGRCVSSLSTACAISGLAVFVPAFAADSLEDSVVVTATRTEQPLSQVGQSISVIDAAAIHSRQTDSVVDLLRTLPGIAVARNGGVGNTTSVFIRGAETDQTVALIDGVKLNDPSSPGGGFNFANLLTGNIARIEVLRGSQSVLWGSQAIAGVVNVITKEPTDELTASARAEYGWRNTRSLVANLSDKFGPLAASVGAGDFRTDGISSFNETRGGSERDGYRNYGAHAKFKYEVSDAVSVDLRGWYSNGRTDFDGFAPPNFDFGDTREFGRTREAVGYTALNAALFDGRFHNRLALAYTDTQRNNFDPDGFVYETFNAAGTNRRFEYQGTLDITDTVRTTFGAESERSRFTSVSFGGPPTRGEARINSAYAEILARPLESLTTIAGVRRDDHDEFGGKTTTGASAVYTPNGGRTAFRASYSEGFKAPTLYQLQSEYGNGLLTPETAKGWEAGITQRFFNDTFEVSATGFRRDTHDLINFISCFTPLTGICVDRANGTYDNIGRARADGVELALALKPFDALEVQANYTNVDSENRSAGANFGKALPRRPRETASAVVDYRWPFGLNTGITFTHAGKSFDNATNTREVESYDVVDLRVAYPVTAAFELQARVENLLDEKYETVFRYGTMRRAAYAGVLL
ncbi:MAG: TonB-dependent receptor, partial [Gammaproteobacteria bacterium]